MSAPISGPYNNALEQTARGGVYIEGAPQLSAAVIRIEESLRNIILSLGVSLLLLVAPAPGGVGSSDEPEDVSMIQLIAKPTEFHGKLVRVIGFAYLEFEGHGLYLHKEDFERALMQNSLWLSVPHPIPEEYLQLNEQYVIVEARFNSERKGQWGIRSGSLEDIARYERWPTRKEMEPPRERR